MGSPRNGYLHRFTFRTMGGSASQDRGLLSIGWTGSLAPRTPIDVRGGHTGSPLRL